MKNIVYFQGGGPTTVINSSLYGVIKAFKENKIECKLYGSLYGVEGLINDELVDLSELKEEEIELLLQTPGAFLGSSRHKLEEGCIEFEKIAKTVKKYNIGYILPNGGNDTMDTCDKLFHYFEKNGGDVKVVGIPKTIDNDLPENYFSLGFPSAARFVANAVKSLIIDASSYRKGKVTVIESMGRDTGWLAASSMVNEKDYRPDLLIVPEMKLDISHFIEKLKEVYEKKKYAIVMIGEGIDLPHINSIADDNFGHKSMEGSGLSLCRIIEKELKLSTRFIPLSLLMRSFSPMMSEVDRKYAVSAGKLALNSALKGENGMMVSVKEKDKQIYLSLSKASLIANNVRKIDPILLKDYDEIDPSLIEYFANIIDEAKGIEYENGIIKNSKLNKRKS